MFGSVRGVGEGLVASFVLADVRLLARVRAQVGFEILQTGVGLGAALELDTQTGRHDQYQGLLNRSTENGNKCDIILMLTSTCTSAALVQELDAAWRSDWVCVCAET